MVTGLGAGRRNDEHLDPRLSDGQVKFDIESYLFQEGKQAVYEKARYAELKVDETGSPSLIQLLDEQLKPIGGD